MLQTYILSSGSIIFPPRAKIMLPDPHLFPGKHLNTLALIFYLLCFRFAVHNKTHAPTRPQPSTVRSPQRSKAKSTRFFLSLILSSDHHSWARGTPRPPKSLWQLRKARKRTDPNNVRRLQKQHLRLSPLVSKTKVKYTNLFPSCF
jgi:hypothetical protein